MWHYYDVYCSCDVGLGRSSVHGGNKYCVVFIFCYFVVYFVVYLHKVLNQTSAIFVKNVFIILLELSKVYDLVGFNVTAPGKFVIEDGCIMKYYSSQVKNAFFFQKVFFHNWVTFVTDCYCQYCRYSLLIYMFTYILIIKNRWLCRCWWRFRFRCCCCCCC